MNLVKLLDVSSPKGIKETLNKLTEYYESLEADITQKTNTANTNSEQAVNTANAATNTANTALSNSNLAVQTSEEAKQIAENATEIAEQAEANSLEALEFANQAFTAADEANLNSETALSVATDAKQSIIDAIETGTLGSQLFNTTGEFLLSLNILDDLSTLDETVLQLASAKSIKDYVDTHTPEIDTSDKLDKVTSSGSIRLYGVNASGVQTMYGVSTDDTSNSIARRTSSGRLKTRTPAEDDDSANKSYVDGLVSSLAKLDATNLSEANTASWKSKLGVEDAGTKVIFRRWS